MLSHIAKHINLSHPNFTTMVLEITHLAGYALFFLAVLKQQLLMVFTPAMLRLLLECHKDLF